MLRTLTTRHPLAANVEYRVSLHQPMKSEQVGGTSALVKDGEPWIVIETFVRMDNGDWKLVASLKEEAFEESVADVRELAEFIRRSREQPVEAEPEKPRRGRRVLTGE